MKRVSLWSQPVCLSLSLWPETTKWRLTGVKNCSVPFLTVWLLRHLICIRFNCQSSLCSTETLKWQTNKMAAALLPLRSESVYTFGLTELNIPNTATGPSFSDCVLTSILNVCESSSLCQSVVKKMSLVTWVSPAVRQSDLRDECCAAINYMTTSRSGNNTKRWDRVTSVRSHSLMSCWMFHDRRWTFNAQWAQISCDSTAAAHAFVPLTIPLRAQSASFLLCWCGNFPPSFNVLIT